MEELVENIEGIKEQLSDTYVKVSGNQIILDEIRKYIVVSNLLNMVNIGLIKKEDLENYQDFRDFEFMLEDFKIGN